MRVNHSEAQKTRVAILRNQELAAARQQQRRVDRVVAICKTIPRLAPMQMKTAWYELVNAAVHHLSAEQLERVVWPWIPRPQRTKTPRGRRAVVAVL